MARFLNRHTASGELFSMLKKFEKSPNTLIVGLPRGGMIIAADLAKKLDLPLDFIVVKKIGAVGNSELALGAVTKEGILFLDDSLIKYSGSTKNYVDSELKRKMFEASVSDRHYRGGKKPKNFKGKKVILVDDGAATGSSLLVAVKAARNRGVKTVTVAVPVASLEAAEKLKEICDDFICQVIDQNLESVGQYYDYFPQVEDSDVIALI
jgi:putative phosphoribosyl transferase